MTISVSVVLLLGLLVWILVRYTKKIRAWQATVCILFGFFLATSPIAPYITSALTSLGRLISGAAL